MQDEGAAIQGLGHTLMEHYIFDDEGRIRNLGAIDYRIPTSMDLPLEMVSEIDRERGRPGSLRRQGHERGRAAVRRRGRRRGGHATRPASSIRDLPLTPERVWRALARHERRADAEQARRRRRRERSPERSGPIGDMPPSRSSGRPRSSGRAG